MRLSFGQHIQQKQTQTLAPQMIQSMEILQLSITQLEERIDQELAENPVLEATETDPALPKESDEDDSSESKNVDEKELVIDSENGTADDFERLLNLDSDVPDYFDGNKPSSNRLQEMSERAHDSMANLVTRSESLQEYLSHQIGELELDDDLHDLCEMIISNLHPEDGGYLKISLMDMMPPDTPAERLEQAEEALKIVQSLDPPGIAARNLGECLLVQIQPGTPYEDEMKTLIQHHLEDLRDNRMPHIVKATGYSLETIQHALEQIRKLNPKPAASFTEGHVANVTPDVWVEQDDNGEYKVRLEEGQTRSLYISKYYRQRLASGEATAEEKEFIRRKVTAAQWLIESIEQRRNTLRKVAQAIVDHQVGFLEYGPEHLQPLKMQQVADKVGVHVTTVSRAVDDKWIETPRGILALRSFFAGGTTTESGEDVAWDKIRFKLQEVIDHEDKTKPFSDDELVKILKSHGLNVARRTITKYRKKMNIPSSRQRREWVDLG
jgi:RNA polymerase sigma-54 factor